VLKLAIATPGLNAYSETFIRGHIERLPADVIVLYGGTPPTRLGDGSAIIPPFTLARHLRWTIERRLKHLTWEDRTRQSLVAALRHLQVDATMGVAVMDVCAEVGVPLIVHFHGFDAYRNDVLSEAGRRYPELFGQAAAIVAVSRDMERHLIGLGAPPDKVHYNPCGVDVSQFGGAAPAEAPPTFVAVLDSVPEARLIMIGEGPLWEASTQLARALGISSAVDFRGVCPHAEVASTMQQARAFVQHSVVTSTGDSRRRRCGGHGRANDPAGGRS